ncbi:MAG: sulfite exporter TauE/SafE family protein [candidate division NC10 bacterium]
MVLDLLMSDLLSFWWLFPAALLIGAVAMTFGIGGAIFFSPFFVIFLSLKPEVAIALGILVDVFAFASGLAGYVRSRLVNYHVATRLLPFVAVFALVGAVVGKTLPSNVLELTLAAALFLLAVAFLGRERSVHFVDHPLHPTRIESERASWADWWQDIEKKPLLFVTSSIGGLFVGLVSAGIGEVNAYNFVRRLKMDPAFAAGTSVFIIAFTALVTTLFNLSFFAVADPQDLLVMTQIAIWAVPGVILGAQLGVRISKRIDRRKALLALPVLFAAVGILTVVNALS